jgi:CBS domain containing-hemolysin-like protein
MSPVLLATPAGGLTLSPEIGFPIIALLVIAEGFFSGSELALVSADRVAIRAAKEEGGRTARLLAGFLAEPERILTTTLIGTNLCVVSSTTVFGLMLVSMLGDESGSAGHNTELLTVLLLSPVLLLFGELIPKSIFRRYSSRLARVVIHPLTWLSYGLFPLVAATSALSKGILRLIGTPDQDPMAVSRDELRLLLKRGEGKGSEDLGDENIEEEELKMIRRIFDFPEVTAKEVMVPLIDVSAVEEAATLEEAAERFVETGFSRLPVFKERVDNIVGVLHAMDVLQAFGFMRRDTVRGKAALVSRLMRPVSYVPPNQKVEQLLEALQHQRHSLAVVVDEWGGAEGVITVEDILEEILGEIEDEHDAAPPDIQDLGERQYLVAARTEVDRLVELLGEAIPPGDYETVAGFLISRLGRIPDMGESIETDNALITVVRATERRVEEVQIVLKGPPRDSAGSEPEEPGSH